MVAITQLSWLIPACGAFVSQLGTGKAHHAQLIGINEGYGGHLLAQFMAAAALCQSPLDTEACGQCKACLLHSAGNHPDFYALKADGNQIKVDQVRDLCRQLTSTAQQGGRRVAVIYHCERLNSAAANALLKTLEEPGKDTLLILQSDTPSRLMATISSRCQRVSVKFPTREDVRLWLQHVLQIADDITWCLPVVGGPLHLAESLQNGHYQQLLGYRKDWAQSLSCGHLCASLINIGEEQIADALKVLYLLIRQQLVQGRYQEPLIVANVAEFAGKVMQQCHRLSLMPNVNYLALCQSLILEYTQRVNK